MMDIPRGMAMAPLTDDDLTDFLYNYFKAEYAPIRSFFSTATAEPRMPDRWRQMGHELVPLCIRPANAQAQKDLESLDNFMRQHNLDSTFVRGIVVRYAKYEIHERLEKKLYESQRVDLMVRKALKEKHLIESLWPRGSRRHLDHIQQGNKVRSWYGDMFAKYFRYLHSLDDYKLRPEVDDRVRRNPQLILIPYIDHLVFGPLEPILPMAAKGLTAPNTASTSTRNANFDPASVRPDARADRFEVRFDAPTYISETHTRSVIRTTECLKCGTKRDVTVVISVDPAPGPVLDRRQAPASTQAPGLASNTSARRNLSKAAQRYSPGHGHVLPISEVRTPRAIVDSTPVLQHDHSIGTPKEIPRTNPPPYTATPSASTSLPTDEKQPPTTAYAPEYPDRPTNPRSSLSFNILNLWPSRPATNTPTVSTNPNPPTNPPTASSELPTSPPTPPPPFAQPTSTTVFPLSPPPPPSQPQNQSLLDTAVPAPMQQQDEEAAGWGDDPSTVSQSRSGEERVTSPSPAILEDLTAEAREAFGAWGEDDG